MAEIDSHTIETVIAAAGGPSAVGRELKITPQAVSQWKRVPAERVGVVERLSGIPRHKIRPDIFAERFEFKPSEQLEGGQP